MKIILTLWGCLGISVAAFASSAETFSSLDSDKDGFISRNEAESDNALSANFQKLDVDGDGQLAWGEFSALKKAESERRRGEGKVNL